MVQENIKTLPVKEAFSKGFIEDKGKNKIPPQYAGYVRNVRIQNKSVTVRKGREIILSNPYPGYIQGMVYNNELLFNADGSLRRISGTIGATANVDVNFIPYGKYTIILTGIGNPYVFDGLGVTQVPDSNMPFTPAVALSGPVKPIIGTAFTGYTMIAGNSPGYDNIMYISKPIVWNTATNSFNIPYDWSIILPATSDNGEYRIFRSRIQGMVANYNNLYVFCEDSIETLGVNSAVTVGSIVSLFTQPIGDGDRLCSSRALVPVGDKIFWMTKSRKIKTLNYIPGVADPEIGELSDISGISIQGFIERELNQDQSKASAVYNKKDNTVRFYVRSLNSTGANDMSIVYDLDNETFLVDNNKSYSVAVYGDNDTLYAGSAISTDVFNEDQGFHDSGVGINFEYDTPNYGFGDSNMVKQFRGYTIAGGINTSTALTMNVYIDGSLVDTQTITSNSIDPNQLSAVQIGGPNQGAGANTNFPFEFTIDHGQIRQNGKKIRIQILSNSVVPSFYLDSLSFIMRAKGRYELNDVL